MYAKKHELFALLSNNSSLYILKEIGSSMGDIEEISGPFYSY